MDLKQELFSTLKTLVQNQANIRNWQIAVDQGSIIRRIYPDAETGRQVDAILRNKQQQVPSGERSSRIWSMNKDTVKKKVSQQAAAVNENSRKLVEQRSQETSETVIASNVLDLSLIHI